MPACQDTSGAQGGARRLHIDFNAAHRQAPIGMCYFWVKIIFRDWFPFQSRKIKKLLFYVGFCLSGLQPAPVLSAGEQGQRRHVPLAAF